MIFCISQTKHASVNEEITAGQILAKTNRIDLLNDEGCLAGKKSLI
jgi:hypothetical protein